MLPYDTARARITHRHPAGSKSTAVRTIVRHSLTYNRRVARHIVDFAAGLRPTRADVCYRTANNNDDESSGAKVSCEPFVYPGRKSDLTQATNPTWPDPA
jgi:hypothetical protein